jgi:hypothetical protein
MNKLWTSIMDNHSFTLYYSLLVDVAKYFLVIEVAYGHCVVIFRDSGGWSRV